jgi:PAS domain S-box-containing protein
MQAIYDLPIKKKLILLMLIISSVSALLTGVGTIIYERHRYKQEIVRDVSAQAEIVGAASAVAMAFGDEQVARETLSALRGIRSIECACIFTADGKELAHYSSLGKPCTMKPAAEGGYFQGGKFIWSQSVKFGNDVVGSVLFCYDPHRYRMRMYANGAIALCVILFALFVAVMLASRLQKYASDPVLELAGTAQAVATSKDYSVRAPIRSKDEIGNLARTFNEMLLQIQKSDAATRASEERFRQLAENICEVFWLTNPDKTETLYVSPAYERIWGRSTEALYAQPSAWLDAIHPEDRERVREAATTQHTGAYDEEYRIVAPDGSVRWIRDRAFPIRDENGVVYRIAGIAEDITERKRLQHQILEISEREQRRIGQDLHDGLSQHLTGLRMIATALERGLEESKHPLAQQASTIRDLISQAIGQTRSLARGLSPVHMGIEGLILSLQKLAEGVELQTGVSCTFRSTPFMTIDDTFVATHLYRITQEAVNNAIRHGRASSVVISLECNSDHGWLTISDNGVGMSAKARRGEGMGLHIMSDRAQMIGGALIVSAGPNGGTVVTCSFKQNPPVKQKEQNA